MRGLSGHRLDSDDETATAAPIVGLRSRLTFTVLLLAGVILPFVLFGTELEAFVSGVLPAMTARPLLLAAAIIALLAADVVLPIPSSIVGAFAGAVFGLVAGAAMVWVGLMLGCIAGYGLGRGIAGVALAPPRPATGRALGPVGLAATRAVPVLAEAGIIAAGAARMRFGTMLLATAPANALVALAYAGAGTLIAGIDAVPGAIAATLLCAAAWGIALWARRLRTRGPR